MSKSREMSGQSSKNRNSILAAALAGLAALLAIGWLGCQKEEGALEKAGRHMDETAEEVADKARELAGEGPMEKFGRHLDKAAEDVKEAVDAIEKEFGK